MSAELITAADLVAEARTWVGTPWHHQGRSKGIGVDCVGLVLGVAKAAGLCADQPDVTDYPAQPDGRLVRILRRSPYITPVAPSDRVCGDIALIAWGKVGQHVGLLSGRTTLIHAYQNANPPSVIETTLGGELLRGLRAVFRFVELR